MLNQYIPSAKDYKLPDLTWSDPLQKHPLLPFYFHLHINVYTYIYQNINHFKTLINRLFRSLFLPTSCHLVWAHSKLKLFFILHVLRYCSHFTQLEDMWFVFEQWCILPLLPARIVGFNCNIWYSKYRPCCVPCIGVHWTVNLLTFVLRKTCFVNMNKPYGSSQMNGGWVRVIL